MEEQQGEVLSVCPAGSDLAAVVEVAELEVAVVEVAEEVGVDLFADLLRAEGKYLVYSEPYFSALLRIQPDREVLLTSPLVKLFLYS